MWPFQAAGSVMVIGGVLALLWEKLPVWAGFTVCVVGLILSIVLSDIESIDFDEIKAGDDDDEHGRGL